MNYKEENNSVLRDTRSIRATFFVVVVQQSGAYCCMFPSLFWMLFRGLPQLKRPLPEDRDPGWSVFPSPCPVSRPDCTPQVRGLALLTQINQSHEFATFSLSRSQIITSCSIHKERNGKSTFRSIREVTSWQDSCSLSKPSLVVLFFSAPKQQSRHKLSISHMVMTTNDHGCFQAELSV